jgi:hypothetical protein
LNVLNKNISHGNIMIKQRIILLLVFIISPTLQCSEIGGNIHNDGAWRRPPVIKKVEPQDPPTKEEIILNRLGNYLYCRDFITLGMINKDFKKAHQKYIFCAIDTSSRRQTTSASFLLTENMFLNNVVTKDCFKFLLPPTSEATSLRHAITSYKYINQAIRITYANMQEDSKENLLKNKQLTAHACEKMINSSYLMLIHKLVTNPTIDINEKDENGNTFLHDALILLLPRPTGRLRQDLRKKTDPTYLNMIKEIAQHPNIVINTINNKGCTALDYAWKDAVITFLKKQRGSYSQFAAYSQSITRHKKIMVLCLLSGMFTLMYVFYHSLPKII